MTELRTHTEMQEVYQVRAEQGKSYEPYILDYSNGEQRLVFFGSRHSADPKDSQWAPLQVKWQEFIKSGNPKKQVFAEGGLRVLDKAASSEQALKDHAESGLIAWMASQEGIEISSPEPPRHQEIDYLHNRGFSYEEIINYYFSRQMLQWNSYDKDKVADWQVYANDLLGKYQAVHDWGGLSLGLDQVQAIYEDIAKKPFSETDAEALYSLSDPSQSEVASASGHNRDKYLLDAIQEKWLAGYDVFVVYGSGHAIVLEPALQHLTNNSRGEL